MTANVDRAGVAVLARPPSPNRNVGRAIIDAVSWQAEAWVQSNPHIVSQMDYCVMVNLANWADDKGQWSPSWQTWAKASRCSVISVRRAVERLCMSGVISLVHRAGRTNTYQINMPGYALPSLIKDAAEDLVAHKLQQAAKTPRLPYEPLEASVDNPAADIHNPAHQMSTPDSYPHAHNEHPPAHPDEHPPAHPDEHRTIINNQIQPRAVAPVVRDVGWEPDPEKRKVIADERMRTIRAEMVKGRTADGACQAVGRSASHAKPSAGGADPASAPSAPTTPEPSTPTANTSPPSTGGEPPSNPVSSSIAHEQVNRSTTETNGTLDTNPTGHSIPNTEHPTEAPANQPDTHESRDHDEAPPQPTPAHLEA